MNRRTWFKVHSWVGFKFSLLLCFILVTGTFATVSHELDWLTNPAMRVSPATVTHTNWAGIYENAHHQLPDKTILHIKAPLEPWFAAEVAYYENDQDLHRLFFHPSSAEYLGDGRWYNWQRFFRMTHRHLMLPIKIGLPIVSAFAIFLLLSLITSLVVYRKWWRGFFRLPRRSHAKLFWGDLHRLIGVWSLWFLLLISLTSLWYLLEYSGVRGSYPGYGKPTSELAQQQSVMPSPAQFASMIKDTKHTFADLKIQRVYFPLRKGLTVRVSGQASAILVRDRANSLSFDPINGDLITQFRGEELNALTRIAEAADPLHFGTFAGLPSKLLYFVFGVLLCILAISGTYLYGTRLLSAEKVKHPTFAHSWQAASDKMKIGKWWSWLMLTVCATLSIYVFAGFY